MIQAFYTYRTFSIRDSGTTVSARPQGSGIAQGCPLSPYLFIIVLTVIFHDVDSITGNDPSKFLAKDARPQVLDVSYADDTLLYSRQGLPSASNLPPHVDQCSGQIRSTTELGQNSAHQNWTFGRHPDPHQQHNSARTPSNLLWVLIDCHGNLFKLHREKNRRSAVCFQLFVCCVEACQY